jgi:TonB family protein
MSVWAQTLLLWSWQSLLLVGLVLVVVRIARAQSAASRHSFWLLSVVVISVLPGVNAIVRALPVEAPSVAPIRYIAQLPEVTVEAIPTTAQSSAPARNFVTPSLFAIWIAGVLISAARSFRAHRRWRRIVRSAAGAGETGSSIPMCYSSEVEAPVLVGTLRPVIVMPADFETWTTPEERRAVLLHEAAHVERRDHWVSPLQAVLGAVFFFHPAVRYALRQLVLERELACDEHVLSVGTSPATYAEVILRVAERSIPGRQSDYPAFNSPGKILERRIEMILSYGPLVSGSRRLPAIGRAAVVVGLTSLLLPQGAIPAEMTLPPPPEISVATFQPLMEGVSVVASAITRKPWAEPVHAAPVQAAQAALGTLSGTIFDPSGAVIPGVTVTLTAVPAGTLQTVVTNGTGLFTFPQVTPGQHRLQTRLPGFANTERTILMGSGGTLVQDVSIAVAGIVTSVEVSARRPATAQNPDTTPLPLRVGGAITQPNLISQVKPQYPAAARASGIEGFVQLQAIIGKDGVIVGLQVDPNGTGTVDPEFVRAAMDAVRLWRYRPGMLNGSPIEVATTITVNFSLQ